jgi:cytochrome c oxidase subunit 2
MNFPVWPEQGSSYAGQYDLLLGFVLLLTVFFILLVATLVVFFAAKYRKGSKANRTRPADHNLPLEVGTISLLLVLALVTFGWAARLYVDIYNPPDNALEIFVIGKQWMWHLQHTNGVRENNELHIPVGQPIKLTMISQDVLHSFFIPAFRVKKDVIPGRYTTVWFTPDRVGQYHLFCSEYCGTSHSEMGGWVYVMEPADYQAWLAGGGDPKYNPAQGAAKGAPVKTMEEAGKQLYARFACGSCHDPDMKRGPILAGLYGKPVKLRDGRTVIADDDYLRKSLVEPNSDIAEQWQQVMPSYKDDLTEEQILQLIAYMKSMGTAQQIGAQAAPAVGRQRKQP